MADDPVVTPFTTPTTNYSWLKPDVGGSTDVWGTQLNTVIDQIDAQVHAGQVNAPGWNRIINGDMRIDQRNNGASGTATGVYTVDRWFYQASQAAKGTWQRGGPAQFSIGLPYSLSFTSSSAYVALTGEVFDLQQRVEADMISDFAWGTSQAQPITLSFWAFSSLTGVFGGAITNATRSYPFTFNIPAANTWTKIVITIPGDTAGAWVLNGNAEAFRLCFDLGSGATFRGPANAWASANYVGATGTVSVVGTNGASLQLTGVKLEIGSVATPFPQDSLAKRLADCQRYYQYLSNVICAGYGGATGLVYETIPNQVAMRAAPTVNFASPVPSYSNASALSASILDPSFVRLVTTITAVGYGYGTSGMQLTAEL